MQKIKVNKLKIITVSILLLIITLTTTASSININDNIFINKTELKQGDIIVIKSKENFSVNHIKFNDHKYKFNIIENKKIAIIPISYWTNAGKYELQIIKNDKIIKTLINILSGNFANSYIKVEKEKEKLIKPEDEEIINRKKEDQKMIKKARQYSVQTMLFESNFIWPVKGPISTEFGATRFVNGKLQSRHSGIDIAVDKGTSILAPNNGVIKLAANLLVTGNTIIIDHGLNIFSSYSHLSQINVKKGQEVQKGEKIGEIGSTGFSTGPHLHWTITVGSVFVNPRNFINNDLSK